MFSNLLDKFQEFWGPRSWAVKLLILAVLFSPLGYYLGIPAYKSFVDWRMDRNMRLAAEALEAGNATRARNLAYSVLLKRPEDIDCIRLTTTAMIRMHDLKRGDMARYLLHRPEATRDDILMAWPVVARLFPMAVVAFDWNSLDENLRTQPDFFLSLVDRLVVEKRYGDAVKLFKPVDITGPTTTALEKRILRILVSCGQPGGIPEAQARLTGRIDRKEKDIAELLPELAPIPADKLDPRLGRALVRWLADLPNPGPNESLAVARFQVALAKDDGVAATTLETTIQRWKDKAPTKLAQWLLATGHPETALTVVPETQPSSADRYRLRREALAALGRWKEILAFISSYKIPPQGITKLEWHLDMTAAAHRLGRISLQSEQWSAAMTEAKITPLTGFVTLARMAKAKGLVPESRLALLEAIRTARGPLPFYSDLFPLLDTLYRQGKAEDMLNVATIYLPIEPGNPIILIHYTYLKSLLGQADAEFAHKLLDPLLAQQPKNPAILRILALQELLDGNFEKAAQILESITADTKDSFPVNRILYGIALLGSGHLDEGIAITESVDWQPLMPAESTLFDQLLAKARENLDPESKAKAEAAAKALALARENARAQAEKLAKAHDEAKKKARADAEKYSRAILEAKEKARQKAKSRAISPSP